MKNEETIPYILEEVCHKWRIRIRNFERNLIFAENLHIYLINDRHWTLVARPSC